MEEVYSLHSFWNAILLITIEQTAKSYILYSYVYFKLSLKSNNQLICFT